MLETIIKVVILAFLGAIIVVKCIFYALENPDANSTCYAISAFSILVFGLLILFCSLGVF